MIRTTSIVLTFLLSATFAAPFEEKVDFTGHQVITVKPTTEGQVAFLAGLRQQLNLDFWNEIHELGQEISIRIPPWERKIVTESLLKSGLQYKVTVFNLQSLIDEELKDLVTGNLTYMDGRNLQLDRYHNIQNIYDFIDSLSNRYLHVSAIGIGSSFEKRSIKGAKITSGSGKPVIFLECGIHAREWISTAVCNYFINELSTKYDSDATIKRLVDSYEWQIFPSVNPDGYEYSQVNRMWRKTRSNYAQSSCIGADANRNFDVGQFCGVGTSKNPCDDTFCGVRPFSEPESAAIRDAMNSLRGRIAYYFSFHSFGQLFMFPYSYTTRRAANHEELMRRATKGASALRAVSGTAYRVGPISTTIYAVTGSTLDWVYDKADVKLPFVLELRPGRFSANGFILPASQIIPTAKETWAGILATIE